MEDTDPIEIVQMGTLEELQEYLRAGGNPNASGPVEVGENNEMEMTLLIVALDENKLDMVKALLDAGANPDTEDDMFGTPLHLAIERGSIEIVRQMIQILGAVRSIELLNDTSIGYRTPLMGAVETGDADMVNLLLEEGADPNVATPEGENAINNALELLSREPGPKSETIFNRLLPLATPERKISVAIDAASRGLVPLVRKLLDSGVDINAEDEEGRTPLISAVDSDNVELVQELLGRGANANLQDIDGETALSFATQEGVVEIVRALLKAGANPNIASKNGYTPLHHAARRGNAEIVRALLEANANPNAKNREQGQTPLMIATWENQPQVVEELLSRAANPNETDVDGDTALYVASQEGRLPIVKLLLRNGADVDKGGMQGATALMVASQQGHRDVVEELLKAGANPNIVEAEGLTALHLAAEENKPEILELLVQFRADINIADRAGMTPINYTATNLGSERTIATLVRLGANVNPPNPPIVDASVLPGLLNNVRAFLKAGANINAQDRQGYTALMSAAMNANADGAAELILAGADKTIRNQAGQTALDLARTELVRGLLEEGPMWRGMNRDDVEYLGAVFENMENFSMCPICLTVVERSEACRYMSHDCSKIRNVQLHRTLYDRYKNDEGIIYWCTICGRICFGHRHFMLLSVRDEPRNRQNNALLIPGGDPFGDEANCRADGGGGFPEKITRMNAMIENAAKLLPNAARLPAAYCRKRLVETSWDSALKIPESIQTVIANRQWTTPLDRFPAGGAGAAAPPPAPDVRKPPADAALVPERVIPPAEGSTVKDMITREIIQPPEYAIRFIHREDNGNIRRHADESLVSREALGIYIEYRVGNQADPRFGYCFDDSCQAKLYPEDIEPFLSDAALLEDYRKKFNERFTVRGGTRKPGVFVIVDNEGAQCALPEKGGRSKTYRKKNKSKRKTYRKRPA